MHCLYHRGCNVCRTKRVMEMREQMVTLYNHRVIKGKKTQKKKRKENPSGWWKKKKKKKKTFNTSLGCAAVQELDWPSMLGKRERGRKRGRAAEGELEWECKRQREKERERERERERETECDSQGSATSATVCAVELCIRIVCLVSF